MVFQAASIGLLSGTWTDRAGAVLSGGKGLTEAPCWPARGQCESSLDRLELAATPLLLVVHDYSSLSDPCLEVGVGCA